MAEPTLLEVFGANASQTSTTITITKADLAAVGLTATAGNTAESILAAIFLKARDYLTEAAFTANIDQSVTILPGFNSIVQRTNSSGVIAEYRQFQWTFNAHKLDASTLDPDDL